VKGFFPTKPSANSTLDSCTYPPECESVGTITAEQIHMQLKKLKLYKAPGPDGILNIILTKSTDLIVERLMHIYQAMLKEGLIYKLWKEFITVVLRKPGKPRYDMLKAYRPISVAATWLRTGPASQSWPFCDLVNRTNPGKSRSSNDH